MKFTLKTRLIAILFIILFAGTLPAAIEISRDSDEAISRAASLQLPQWLEKIPTGQERYFGFFSREDFSRATVGVPIHIYHFADELSTTTSHPGELLVPSYEWRVPVIVDNECRALATVAPVNGEWKIVDFGAAGLAQEIGNVPTGHLNILVRSFTTKSDFLAIPSGDLSGKGVMLMPLQSARRNIGQLDHAEKDLFTIDEIRGMILIPEAKPGLDR